MRFLIMLMVLILAGCGGDDDSLEEGAPIANFVSAVPPGGCTSDIAAFGGITVTFDNPPQDVTVSHGTVTVKGKTVTIVGPFTPGPLALTMRNSHKQVKKRN